MVITPNSNIRLLKVPLTLDNKNQITFLNKQAQFNYFNSLPYIELDDSSYQRKDNIIRFNDNIDDIINFNYVMYQNENYSNKWFYAFITNMQYINDGRTDISIVTDVWQTWQFDLIFKESFVEREMINISDDIPGANLLPEGLEIGEMKVGGTAEFDELEPAYVVAFTGDKFGDIDLVQNGNLYNGIYSSVKFIVTDKVLSSILQQINIQGNGDKILTVFSIPKLAVLSLIPEPTPGEITYWYEVLEDHKEPPLIKSLISTPSSLDGYTPRNQKLRTYPYVYLGFNPNNGSSKIYRYEDFENGTPSFKVISEINPAPEVIFIPQNYRGQSGDSLSDISSLSGYPNISYKNDVFNTWLAQNSEIVSLSMQRENYNYEIGQIQGSMNIGNSMVSTLLGNPSSAGGIISGSLELAKNDVNHDFYVKNQMAQIEKQKLLPDNSTLSSSNATLLGYNMIDKNIFTRYTIKNQFAKRIDKFFDMYGYLTNELKIPNISNRPNWNYVKTIGANIIGDIPETDLLSIRTLFDNGITLWHNTNTFLDYAQNNR